MLLSRVARFATLLLASLSLATPALAARPRGACPDGETKLHGRCVKACPTGSDFTDPDACECPAGFGKILLGNGNGHCDRLRCQTGALFPQSKVCDCPAGYEKSAPKKGKIRCELKKQADSR